MVKEIIASAQESLQDRPFSSVDMLACETWDEAACLNVVMQSNTDKSFHVRIVARTLTPSVLMHPALGGPPRKKTTFDQMKNFATHYHSVTLVFPLDYGSCTDQAPLSASFYGLSLAPAVPSVISWILSDPVYYENIFESGRIKDLPKYEEFLTRKQMPFLNYRDRKFLLQRKNIDLYSLDRAAMISPSLRGFLSLLSALRNKKPPRFSLDLNKALLSNLVMECYPANKEIYRYLDGTKLTGEQMIIEIKNGSEIGKKYTSDLLRVSRDLLARQAEKFD